MNPELALIYTGGPVRVDAGKITDHLQLLTPWQAGATAETLAVDTGREAAALFDAAVTLEALVPPEGLTLEAYCDDEDNPSMLMLAVCRAAPTGMRLNISSGWNNVEDYHPDDGDRSERERVVDALEQFTSALNAPLGCVGATDEAPPSTDQVRSMA